MTIEAAGETRTRREIIRDWALATLAIGGNLSCGTPPKDKIRLHCSPAHRPVSVIGGKFSRHLDVEIDPATDQLRQATELTVIIVGYRWTVFRYIKEVAQINGQDPNATRIAHLPASLSVTHGDRVEVVLGSLTRDRVEARQGVYVGSARIAAGTLSCSRL